MNNLERIYAEAIRDCDAAWSQFMADPNDDRREQFRDCYTRKTGLWWKVLNARKGIEE